MHRLYVKGQMRASMCIVATLASALILVHTSGVRAYRVALGSTRVVRGSTGTARYQAMRCHDRGVLQSLRAARPRHSAIRLVQTTALMA